MKYFRKFSYICIIQRQLRRKEAELAEAEGQLRLKVNRSMCGSKHDILPFSHCRRKSYSQVRVRNRQSDNS